MLREHRLSKIEEALTRQPFLEVKTLARQLRVSDATVRRDLEALHVAGRLKRTRGGAMLRGGREHKTADSSTSPTPVDPNTDAVAPFSQRETLHADAKERIGEAAAELVHDGQSILLAGGTTCLAAARYLRHHHVSVVTNSLPAATLLGGTLGVDVTVTGGMVYSRRDILIGPYVAQTMEQVHAADVLFLGCSGADADGFYDSNRWEVEAQYELMKRANRVVLLLDSSKFNRQDMVFVAPWSDVHTLVTDVLPEQNGSEALAVALREANVHVIVANAGSNSAPK